MKSPRKNRRLSIISLVFAVICSLVVSDLIANTAFSSEIGVIRLVSAAGKRLSGSVNANEIGRASNKSTLQPISGRLIFDSANYTIRGIDNVGTTNDVRDLTGIFDSAPVFSPDGSKVIFKSRRDADWGLTSGELYIMEPDGSNQRRLTFNSDPETQYSFSGDASKITFLIYGTIWVMNSDGSNPIAIPDPEDSGSLYPVLSPDGSRLSFIRDGYLWIANSDGTNQEMLSSSGGEWPIFTPNGQQLIWSDWDRIYRINIDGTNEEEIVNGSGESYEGFSRPQLSPNGGSLLFSCSRFSSSQICVAPPNGSNAITSFGEDLVSDVYPVWSPTGGRVAFVTADGSGTHRIMTANPDGTGITEVFNASDPFFYISTLSWQPDCIETGGAENPLGLISWWRAENNANDSHGTNDGDFDPPIYVQGRIGSGFYAIGTGNRVEVPDSPSLDVQPGDYTLAAWVNLQEQREHYIAGKGACSGTESNFYLGVDEENRPFMDISHENSGGSRVPSGSTQLPLYTWNHLALRKEGTQFWLFINGVQAAFHIETNTIEANDAPFTIGAGDECTPPELSSFAIIDEVYLYGRALSNAEISHLYLINNGPESCPPRAEIPVSLRIMHPHPVAQGRGTSGEISIPSVAGPGGVTIDLQSTDPALLTVPPSAFIPEGGSSTTFPISAAISDQPNNYLSVDVIATSGTDAGRHTVTIAPASPDLAASNLVAPPVVNILQNFNADITVTNNGQVATGSYREDEIWISQDDILFNDPSDTFVGLKFDNSGALAPGQSKVFTATNISIPSSAIPTDGTYYLFYRVGRNINERNGNFQDNYASTPIQVNRNLPDLVAENIVVPAEIEPGVQFTINWDVRNAGSAATQSGFSHIAYISFDQTIGNADDVAIAQRNTAAMAAGQTQSFSQQYTVPTLPVRASSDALIYVVVDTAGQVFEDDPGGPAEINNTTSTQTRFEYRVPDLQVASVTPPAEVDSDTQFAIEWTTTNAGLRAAGPMWERVFFSTDNQVGGDVQIGEFIYNNSIAPGETITRIQNVTIPTNAISATGDYYVYVQTDVFNQVNEGANENNNITFAPVRVRRLLRPDLEVTNITAPPTAFFDQEIQVQWTITNTGTGPTNAPNWRDQLFIGPNPSLNAATFLTAADNISSLEPGESYITTATVRIPRGFTGAYHLVVRTDVNNTVNEENENNNLSTKAITLNVPPLPDLRVANVQAPAEGFAGAPILVSWTVTNHGDGAVPQNESTWRDAVYLSRDTVFDGGDRLIGSRIRNGGLSAGASYTANNFSVDLPMDAFGEYYVFVFTDVFNNVYEYSNENNNTDYDRIEPGSPMDVLGTPPDLTISGPINAPSAINAGQSLTATFTVQNQGAFDAVGTWREALYLSADQTLDPLNDIFLGDVARNGLAAGQSYSATINTRVPNCLDGTFYLLAVTDAYNNIFEFDPKGNGEANNLSAPKALNITSFAPDLRVTNINIPPVVINGAMPISWTVRNFGTSPTLQAAWSDRVYLVNNGQVLTLGTFQRQGALAIDGEYVQNQVVNVPLFLQGEVTIYVQTDFYNAVPECSFEENNQGSAQTQLQSDLPDLRINSVGGPSAATLGSEVTINWIGQNYGSSITSASWLDRVFLSTNATLEFSDIPLGGQIFNQSLGTNGTYAGQIVATVPNVAVGSYYLIVAADAGSNIAEGINENNNTLAIPITLTTPQVDLQVTNIDVSPALFSGQFADITWTVTNSGSQATASASWSDWLVLSRDAVFDPSDTVLAFQRRNGALGAGSSYTENRSVTLPAGLTGDYRILVITDRHNEVSESNETNNISSLPVVLQFPPPAELNITNITPPSSITLGQPASFSWTVQNSSPNAAAGTWQDALYLSTDQTWDSGDIYIGRKERSGTLAAFSTYTETLNVVIPPVDPGNYYVIVRVDSRNTIREANETNNVSSSLLQTSVGVQELTLGIPQITTLVTGQERFFGILNTPADEVMLIDLDGESGSSNELYTRFGSMVSRANYQFQGSRPGEADQENVVPNTSEGNYFTMIRGDFVPGSFAEQLREGNEAVAEKSANASELSPQNVTLRAELLPFTVRRVSPSTAGNAGISSLQVDGAKFDPEAELRLVGAGGFEITPVQMDAGPTRIAAIFDLKGSPAGTYDVVVTNPGDQSAVLEDAFQIVNGGGYQLRASIPPGPTTVRGGLTQRFTFTAHNDGINDALNVPIFIQIPAGYSYQIDRTNYLEFPNEALPPDAVPANIPMHVDIDGIRTIMLYAPLLRAGSSINVRVDVALPLMFGEFPVAIQLLPSLGDLGSFLAEGAESLAPGLSATSLENATNPPTDPDCWKELIRQIFFAVVSELLPKDCLEVGWNVLFSSADLVSGLMLKGASGVGAWDAVSALGSKIVSTVPTLAKCAGKSIPFIKGISLTLTIIQILNQLDDCLGGKFKAKVIFRQPLSIDPNEKLGPEGYGPERFVGVQEPIEYRINFENMATAEAPAQLIRIVDELPPTLDPRSFRLKEIGFKQYRIEVPENRAFYQTRMQLGEDLGNIQADISAGLNILTGTATWTFTAIDPQTNERPLNPLIGLLPPNNEDRDGEGYVIFTIQPKANQPTGTELANLATIYFDENEPIVTEATMNTLDADIPESSVSPLPETADTPVINLSWSGMDAVGGSGLAGITIFFSENGGSYRPLLTTSEPGSAVFTGNWGRTYRFYSVATDNAGNVESAPETPDAVITVLGGAFEGDVAPRPNGNNEGSVTVADVTQVRRFVAELDTDLTLNEFQRADTAPLATRGDGILSVGDIVQTRRYAAGLDVVNFAAGPNEAADPGLVVKTIDGKKAALMPREIRPVAVSRVGDTVKIAVDLEAQGDEVAVGFTLNFDPNVIGNPTNITLSTGATGMSLTTNTSQVLQGRIGIVMDKDPTQPIPAGTQRLLTIDFDVAPSNPSSALIAFGNSPVRREVVNGLAQTLTTTFSDTVVSLVGPTSAPATIAGRVTNFNGSGVQNVVITVTNVSGTPRRATTNAFGYFRLEGLPSGQTYAVTAAHRSFTFDPPGRVITLDADIADVDFRALR